MEGIAGGVRKLAYSVRAHESLEQEGVIKRLFEALQTEGIIRIRMEAVCMDSTTVKVHPNGTGALKNRKASNRQVARRTHNQDSSGHRI